MPAARRRRRRPQFGDHALVAVSLLALLLAGGTVSAWVDAPRVVHREQVAIGRPQLPAHDVAADVPQPVDAPRPVRLRVPTIGVDTALVSLGLNPDGSLQVPSDSSTAGWYVFGPNPGDRGPAVIAGHVDSVRGPAVFFSLRRLRPGDAFIVERADGSRASFAVRAVKQVPKTDFPTAEVFGPVPGPELRLITCGGPFDRSRHSYVDNVVVFASLVGVTRA